MPVDHQGYHDKRRKDLEFEVGDHVFLRVTPWTRVGRALKSQKLTPRFISPFQILKRVGPVAYQIALPPSLTSLHNVFHVSQIHKYINDPSHMVNLDVVQVKENLAHETLPLRIKEGNNVDYIISTRMKLEMYFMGLERVDEATRGSGLFLSILIVRKARRGRG